MRICIFGVGLALTAALPAQRLVSVDWSPGSVITGDLNGTSVAVTGLEDTGIGTKGLSGAKYSAAPLSAPTEAVFYDARSDWTATFDNSVSGLLLYAISWRGTSAGPSVVNYTFDQPFTVLSGFYQGTVSGTTLTVPGGMSGFHGGVIRFSGSVTSVSCTTNSTSGSTQVLTFGCHCGSVATAYGSDCGFPVGVTGEPALGSSYTVRGPTQSLAAAAGTAALFLGATQVAIDLTALGFPGCELLTSSELHLPMPFVPNPGPTITLPFGGTITGPPVDGQFQLTIPVPSTPSLVGLPLYHQALHVAMLPNVQLSQGIAVTYYDP
ncbi:MAG: hypothetical protein AAF628_13840 [Planctomycetota bacterium]